MRKFLLFPLLLGVAVPTLAQPTGAPKPPAAKPASGEIKQGELRLDGKITAFLGTGLWQLDAISWTSPRGVKTDFEEAKAKTVQLAADAFIHSPNSAAKINVKDIPLKSIVAVIGKNGADGTVQVREVILLEAYGERQTVGTLSINADSSRLIDQSRAARDGGQLLKSIELAQRAAEVAVAKNDASGEALCRQDLGNRYQEADQDKSAMEAFKRAQSLGEKLNNPMVQVLALGGQGRVAAGMGQTEQAITLCERAVTISANSSNLVQLNALTGLAQIYMLTKKNNEAIGALQRVFPLEEETGKYDDATETLISIATLQAPTDPTSARARLSEVSGRMTNIRTDAKRLELTIKYAAALQAVKDDAAAAAQFEAAAKLAEANGDAEGAARIRALAAAKPAAPNPPAGDPAPAPF